MADDALTRGFTGSIPQVYDAYLVPMIFEPYARDLAERVRGTGAERVLEIAAGTGVVTRAMASALPAATTIVATDFNQAMLDHAARLPIARPVEWRQADAMKLPFDDASFDAVVCQFGAMFFPDRALAYAEARRALAPGGTLLFNVWDRIETNEFTEYVQRGVEAVFGGDAPRFLPDVPHGYFDHARIAEDLGRAGFTQAPSITVVAKRSYAPSPRHPAIGFCQGSPLRNQIDARDPSRLTDVVEAATAAVAKRFGDGAIEGGIQAHVIQIAR
jgi:SAM-dependent methyltransferase